MKKIAILACAALSVFYICSMVHAEDLNELFAGQVINIDDIMFYDWKEISNPNNISPENILVNPDIYTPTELSIISGSGIDQGELSVSGISSVNYVFSFKVASTDPAKRISAMKLLLTGTYANRFTASGSIIINQTAKDYNDDTLAYNSVFSNYLNGDLVDYYRIDSTEFTPQEVITIINDISLESTVENSSFWLGYFKQEFSQTQVPLSINITSPNGAEALYAGETFEITWTSEGDINYVRIEYSVNNDTGWTEIVVSTDNDGSYDWIVPCDHSDEYLIRISDVDSEVSDASDGAFSIIDDLAPYIEVSVSPDILWPPNHKMVPLTTTVIATDNCDTEPIVELVSITMNESDETITYDPNYDQSIIDGQTSDDIQIIDDWNFYLRCERSGKSDGRIYTITYRAIDAAGNVSTAYSEVLVPHSM
jgi:hypothetical protein